MPTSQQVREQLDHPIIDADGHVIELLPAAWPYLREALGSAAFERYRRLRLPVEGSVGGDPRLAERRRTRAPQSAWWGNPAANTLDLATASVPRLLHERLGELGIDFAVLYPTKGLGSARYDDEELRRGVCRGMNDYYADVYGPFADRMAVGGIVPMHTPGEAIDELRHCAAIGLKVVGIPEGVWRPIPEPADDPSPWLAPGQTHWFDNFGLDSAHDYDPVWAEMVALGYPLVSHGGLGQIAPNQYLSISNYSANHMGAFRDKMYQLCKSLYMGGVTRRFPTLGLAFLECGVGWASILLADIVEHWEKRRPSALAQLDPATIDWALLGDLFDRYGADLLVRVAAGGDGDGGADLGAALRTLPTPGVAPEERDDWRHLEVTSADDLVELFAPRMYFGCEADDRSVALAFSAVNPLGARLRPVFSSDIAHWDVPDMAGVVAESWELVEDGLLSEAQYRQFVFENPVELLTRANPRFFEGTALDLG